MFELLLIPIDFFLAKPQSWGAAPRFGMFHAWVPTRARRPAQRTPRPQNLQGILDWLNTQPCGVRGWGGAVEVLLGAPWKWKLFTTVCAGPPIIPPAHKTCTVTQTYKSGSPAVPGVGEGQGVVLLGAVSNEFCKSWDSGPGLSHAANVQVWNLAGRPSKTFCRGIQVLVTGGAVSSAVERSDSMFGSWRKLPGAQPSLCPPNIIWPHRRGQETFLSVPAGSGAK